MKIQNLLILIFAVAINSCGNYEEFKEDPTAAFSQITPGEVVAFDTLQKEVLGPKCVSCHANYKNYEDVVADSAKISQQIASNAMPPTGPLNDADKGLYFTWVASGRTRGDAPQTPPIVIGLQPTYESIQREILGPKCTICHNPNGQVPFLDFSTRDSIWNNRNYLGLPMLNFDDPESSYILEVIQDPFEPMPPLDSPFEQVTPEEIATLKEWIRRGLP